MSLSSIKHWVATVDISHTDWRLRWPLIILPFLLVALLYALLRANQLSGAHAVAMVNVQKLLQSNDTYIAAATQSAAVVAQPNDTTRESSTFIQFDQGLASLESQANLLQKWLAQGRTTISSAEKAAALARMITVERTNQSTLPGDNFWNGFSDRLALLEDSVIAGDIKTPEARNLIAELRSQYAQLRSFEFEEPAPTDELIASANSQADYLQMVSGALTRARQQRANITKMHNRALVLAALCTGLFVLLLWGMWRSAQNRLASDAGRNRQEQSAILRLLDEISPLAQGDLRVKATVSEASTGAVADAFNFAIEELRRLVRAVTESAELVKSSVHETRESAHHLARASSVQSREIHRSSNYLNVMSDTMAQLSAHAVESSRIADQSVRYARTGNNAVKANVDGLLRIREQADMTSRLMQRLVETSAAINERVTDIQTVAKRTDLLALNATIRSSAHVTNGDGDNISVLSDEIAHLADTLGRASRDITHLSDLIQQDATITLESMADTVNELDHGQRTAQQASDALNEIDRVSIELNSLIGDIASKSLRQAGVVKQLSANMGVINNITRDSTVELQDSANALAKLEVITAELRDSVSDFKLPRNSSAAARGQAMPRGVDEFSQRSNTVRVNSKVARSTVKHA